MTQTTNNNFQYNSFEFRLKFWSCCTRKTSDFSKFLEQEGCESLSNHLWTIDSDVSFLLLSIHHYSNISFYQYIIIVIYHSINTSL